jgi:hypothetical protein
VKSPLISERRWPRAERQVPNRQLLRQKDHDGASSQTCSMAIGVWLLHDFVVHELLNLLLGEAVHQLAGLVCRLEVLAALAYFVDMHLIGSVLFLVVQS